MNCLLTQDIENIDTEECTAALEQGSILFFPEYALPYIDPTLLSDKILDGKHKNISYDYQRHKLGGFNKKQGELSEKLAHLLKDYAEFAHHLVAQTLPEYLPHLQWGRTSYRPAQIRGRASSKRKDDTRLHVDSFAASPVNGLRILRIFVTSTHIKSLVYGMLVNRLNDVMQRFSPQIKRYNRLTAYFLKWVKATKTLRSPYDHYMLHLHDRMKLDDHYQHQVSKTQIDFPAQSSWIVFTDHVSHAALSGQYLLEQTFYLPINYMVNPDLSPFKEWEKCHKLAG